jgi:hypothetical protein
MAASPRSTVCSPREVPSSLPRERFPRHSDVIMRHAVRSVARGLVRCARARSRRRGRERDERVGSLRYN